MAKLLAAVLQYCPFCGSWSKPGGGCQTCGKPLVALGARG